MYTILIILICILCISAFCHLSTCVIIHMKLSTSIYNIHMDLSTCIYTILMNLLICISYRFVDSPLCSAATLSPRWSPCSLQDSANQQVRFHWKKNCELTISFFSIKMSKVVTIHLRWSSLSLSWTHLRCRSCRRAPDDKVWGEVLISRGKEKIWMKKTIAY